MMSGNRRRLALRHVRDGDCRLLWRWVNDPVARRSSFQGAPISWQEHRRWFARRHPSAACRHYLLLVGRRPVAQVRFDLSGQEADVDFSVAPAARGHGVGSEALAMACRRLARETRLTRVIARIKPDNVASIRTVERAGFRPEGGGRWVCRLRGPQPRPVYLVAARHPWNREVVDRVLSRLPGHWVLVDRPEALRMARLERFSPRFVFFLHWSWRVPEEILARYECVGFHMTDLPYGRGGSPLQHLILRGHRTTRLTAFRMTTQMDAGPVYAKSPLSLAGSAEAIYRRAALLAATMIQRLVRQPWRPLPQHGRVVVFRRRTPAQSRLTGVRGLRQLAETIRMLDAAGYPRAFVEEGGFRYEFSAARLRKRAVEAHVRIMPSNGGAA